MAIALLILLAMTLAAVAVAASRQRTDVLKDRNGQGQKTPSDQIRPLPRHAPMVDSQVYS